MGWMDNMSKQGISKEMDTARKNQMEMLRKKSTITKWEEYLQQAHLLNSTKLRKFSRNLKVGQKKITQTEIEIQSGRKTNTYTHTHGQEQPKAVAQYQMT